MSTVSHFEGPLPNEDILEKADSSLKQQCLEKESSGAYKTVVEHISARSALNRVGQPLPIILPTRQIDQKVHYSFTLKLGLYQPLPSKDLQYLANVLNTDELQENYFDRIFDFSRMKARRSVEVYGSSGADKRKVYLKGLVMAAIVVASVLILVAAGAAIVGASHGAALPVVFLVAKFLWTTLAAKIVVPGCAFAFMNVWAGFKVGKMTQKYQKQRNFRLVSLRASPVMEEKLE